MESKENIKEIHIVNIRLLLNPQFLHKISLPKT